MAAVALSAMAVPRTARGAETNTAATRLEDATAPAIVLPMPGGAEMAFRPVYLGIGDAPFALREFVAGDPSGGEFAETPTKMAISGSLLGFNPRLGQDDWYYLLGETEVTAAQYEAVMGTRTAPNRGRATTPQTDISWFDAIEFLRRYNLWLLSNAVDRLPKHGVARAWLRLPSEAEWEFAARGGHAVASTIFDSRCPFPAESLEDYEHFFLGSEIAGPRPVKFGKPGPLGFYDLLGNVSEMTATPYAVEYYQGRQGGMVIRGGDFSTERSQIRAGRRSEQALFDLEDKTESRSPYTGFRVAMGAPIYTDPGALPRLSAAWASYRASRRVPTLARASTQPVLEQNQHDYADVTNALNRLQQEIAELSGVNPELTNRVAFVRNWYGDMNARLLRQQEMFARTLIAQGIHAVRTEYQAGREHPNAFALDIFREVVLGLESLQPAVVANGFKVYEANLNEKLRRQGNRPNSPASGELIFLRTLRAALPDRLRAK